MRKYLFSNKTAKQIGQKYGFSHRQLRKWFVASGRIESFERKAKENLHTYNCIPKKPGISKISGYKSIAWNGGRKLEIRKGIIRTVLIKAPNHPNVSAYGYYPEHRLIMEKHIKRRLKKHEVVHHIDLDPTNNDINNLLLLDNSQHIRLHYYLQLALVQLMSRSDLRRLSKHLRALIKKEGRTQVLKKKRDIFKKHNKHDDKMKGGDARR